MSPRIGRLRHRLIIEEAERSADAGGGSATAWREVAEVWGAVSDTSGKEKAGHDRIGGEVSHQITIRYRSDLKPAMRFRRGDEIFELLAVLDPDGRKRFLNCLCERRDL